jgi:hypothetical protein
MPHTSPPRQEVDKLAAVVGDPETVADVKGWLPAERREMALTLFEAKRGMEVRDLRARIDGQATLKTRQGTPGQAELREALRKRQGPVASRAPPRQSGG